MIMKAVASELHTGQKYSTKGMDYFQATADSSVGPFCIAFTIKNTKHVKKKKKEERNVFLFFHSPPLSPLLSASLSSYLYDLGAS